MKNNKPYLCIFYTCKTLEFRIKILGLDVYPIYADRERLVKEEFPLWSQRIFDYLKVREVRKEEITGYYIVYSETPEILKFLKKASSS